MLENISGFKTWVSGIVQIAKDWWFSMNTNEKTFVCGVGAVGLAIVAGGIVFEGLLVGALTNAFFWFGFAGPGLVAFMQKAGWIIDAVVTVGVMFIGGAHAMIAGVFIAGIFSVCRRILIPKVEKIKTVVAEVKADVKNLVAGDEPVAQMV